MIFPLPPALFRTAYGRTPLRRALLPALLALGLALAGCAARQPGAPASEAADISAAPPGETAYQRLEAPTNAQQSLVFGYLDLSEAPSPLGWVEFRQVSPATSRPYYEMRVDHGVFYMEKFPPGVYVMGQFGGRRADGTNLAYTLPRNSPAVHVAIHTPGLHFVGAYKYRAVKQNGQPTGRFEIDKLPHPDEVEVLRRILPHARGTPWAKRIQARLDAGG